jgi:cell division septal protein FtsQ
MTKRRRPTKRKAKTALTVLLCLLLAGIVAVGVALTFFRPQLKSIY